MNDPRDAYIGTKDVEARHRFDIPNLEAYMDGHVAGFRGPLTVRQFRGGQSNPTYKVEAPSGTYVLRRKPPGTLLPSAHAVEREYRVMGALHGVGFPVPEPYLLCEDESVVGTVFFIMEFIEGRVFWDPALPGVSRSTRGAIYDAMNETLAKLHSYDVETLGLADFGRPGNYFARQLSRWSKQYQVSETESIREMDRLTEWLPENNPSDDTTCLVHGDYNFYNILFHPREPRVAAVLDWEISTLGHPLGDVSTNALIWFAPKFEGGMATLGDSNLDTLGIPSQDSYIAAYCKRSGRDHAPAMAFYRAYALFRLACIYQGIMGRVRDGTAANPQATVLAARIRPLAEAAWREAQTAGAR